MAPDKSYQQKRCCKNIFWGLFKKRKLEKPKNVFESSYNVVFNPILPGVLCEQ
jgi:hypothetical protein